MPDKYNLGSNPPNTILRKKYAQDEAWIAEFLQGEAIGHIATRWDEQPFITPVLFWYEAETHAIYFHTNITGRLRANIERHPQACFEACKGGKLLPSNVALEFAYQYESAVAFGAIRLVVDPGEQRRVLTGLIAKYFPDIKPGAAYRPIQDDELKRTAVYAFDIQSWSGKRNWKERAMQSDDWPPLATS
jgi:nitroimidazol reductase NimA-like FMN-containing flavoprotein (pyridoxamine 5'-phosphate oxidase superfamily)